MQGHSYVAMRRLTVQVADGSESHVVAGQLIPTELTDTWAEPAIRALVNTKQIQFASVAEHEVLPYLPRESASHPNKKPVAQRSA